MADLSDVSAALAALVTAALYPNGTSQPSAIGSPCKICEGWPIEAALDADLQGKILKGSPPALAPNGVGPIVTVSIYPQPNMERVTTRYAREWTDLPSPPPTITATVSGSTVTFGGTVTAGNYATLIVGAAVYSYTAIAGDTLASVAAALAALTAPPAVASVAGATVTFPSLFSGRITARCAAPVQIIREIRRQQRSYQITVWAPSNALRIAAASIIDPLLAATDFITLASDSSQAWLTYRVSNDSDNYEKVTLYRRDICYWVEYATTQLSTGYPVTAMPVGIEMDGPATPDLTPLPLASFTPVITTES